jgi:hypothetical protein
MVSKLNFPSQTSINAKGGPIREAATLQHLKSHSASVYTTDTARDHWRAQVHTFKTDQSHTSGSKRNDGSDSMFALVIGEWYVHRTVLAYAAFKITLAYSFNSQAHGSLFKQIHF